MLQSTPPLSLPKKIETVFEEVLFRSRWILAPAYLTLVGVMLVLSYKTIEEFVQLVLTLHMFDEWRTILQVLTVVDIVLVLNLVLMVLFVGYVNFVSVIKPKQQEDVPGWMHHLDYSGLKLQLMGSIIAIASIELLRTFLEMLGSAVVNEKKMFWAVAVYAMFLMAALIIAIANRLKPAGGKPGSRQGSPDPA